MRLDIFLKIIGITKRRSVSQMLIKSGKIKLNGQSTKPAKEIHIGDIINIENRAFRILDVPSGNVKKEDRQKFYEKL